MNTKMYVITHKRVAIPKLPSYTPLLVGAELNGLGSEFACCDNDGDNISEKNKNYCELTGIYWAWKNSDADIIGISHYRRFFTRKPFSIREDGFLSETDMQNLLSRYDVVVPPKWYLEKSVIDSVKVAPNKEDMKELEQAIRRIAPDYLETYNRFIHGNESYLYNMCIMKKELLGAYCQWLFPILLYIEQHHDISKEDAYRSRLFGFLSERLLGVWLMKNVASSRIKEVRVVKTDESAVRNVLHEVKNQYRRLIWNLRKRRVVN